VVVYDVPLLVEKQLERRYDVVVVVDASDEDRLHRLLVLRGMTEADARARMASQAAREERLAAADLVLHNDRDVAHLADQVDRLWEVLESRARGA
jgi:dephospho-CoA kinase